MAIRRVFRKGDLRLKRRLLGNPLWLSLVMTFVLAWIQIDAAYFIAQTNVNRQWAIYAPLAAAAVFFALIAVYVALGRRGGLLHWGESSLLLGFFGVAAGANLLLNCGQQAWAFYEKGIAPPPYYTVFSNADFGGIDRLFLNGTLIFGVLGGVALLVLGFLWMFGKKAGSVGGQWLSVLPILWAFCRLARYVQSYASTIRNAFSATQAALLILSLLFFYMFGQHLNGRTKLAGVGLPACAFAFGIVAISAFFSQWFIRAYCPDRIAGVVVIADVTDLLCGAFALAVGTVACSKKAAEKTAAYKESKDAAALMAVLGAEEETAPTVTLTQTPIVAEEAPAEAAEEIAVAPVEDVPAEETSVEAPEETSVEDAADEIAAVATEESDVTE